MESINMVNSVIPTNFDIKSFERDHFFSAIVESLNNIRTKMQLTPKQLRTKCKDFVDEQIKKDSSMRSRILTILKNRSKYCTIHEYCLNIVLSAEECETYGMDLPIPGQPEIEGRFISELFKVEIHLAEYIGEDQFKHYIINKDVIEEVEPENISYRNTNMIHIIKMEENEYCAAIQNNPSSSETNVDYNKKRGGTIDSGRIYEEGISAHVAIKCALNEDILDFDLFNNVDGLGAFDDVVLKVKYGNGRDDELFAFQLKHKEHDKVNISKVFDTNNGIFYLPKYEESYKEILKLHEENPSLEIFDEIHIENIKFILFSNIRFNNKDTIETNKYKFIKETNCSDIMKCFSTKKDVLPYKIVNKIPSSQQPEVSDEFLSKCWVFPSQINANDIEELIKSNLENNIYPDDKIKIILSCFAAWTRQKRNEKIGKSDMINLIIEHCLPHYNDLILEAADITNHSLVVKILNENCYFPFIEVSNLEMLKKSLLQEIEDYIGDKINNDLWHAKINKEDTNKLKSHDEYSNLLAKRKIFFQHIRYNHLLYILWQAKKLPMLVKFSKDTTRCIEFLLNKFEKNLNTKSFVFIYEESPPTIRKEFNKIINFDMLDKISVSLQGNTAVNLRVLTNTEEKVLETITPDILMKLLKRTETIGSKLEPVPYYIHRKVKIPLLKKTVLNQVGNLFILNDQRNIDIQKYVDEYKTYLQEKIDKNGIKFKYENVNVLHSKLPTNESIRLLNIIKEKCKYVLIKQEESEYFHLIKSNGSVEKLRNHLVKEDTFLVKEQDLLQFVKSPVNIISNTAGMGKTSLLQSLANNAAPEEWTIYLNLIEHVHKLDSFDYSKDDEKIVEYLVECQVTENKFRNFIKELLLTRSKDGRLTLLLDGYDEIMFKQVGRFTEWATDKNIKVCITTRPSKIAELEDALGIFSLEMTHFDDNDQTEFLRRFYEEKHIQKQNIDSIIKKVEPYCKTFDGNFIGIPLQTKLLADVLLEVPEQELKEIKIDLVYLYEQFLNKKIEEFEKHKHKTYKTFCKKLSLTLFYTKELLETCNFDFNDLNDRIEEFRVDYRKDFIISGFTTKNTPMFVHRTYAEFLAAQYLYEQLIRNDTNNKEKWEMLTEKLYYMEMTDIRYFMDRIAAKNCKLHKAVLNNNAELVKDLLELSEEKDELGRTALDLACSYGKRFDLDTVEDISGLTNLEKHIKVGLWIEILDINHKGNEIEIPVLEQKFIININIFKMLLQSKKVITSEWNFALKTGSLEVLEHFPKIHPLIDLPQTKMKLLLYHCTVNNFGNILKNVLPNNELLNTTYNSNLLIHIAAIYGNFEAYAALHEKGAETTDSSANKLLHMAAKYGQHKFIEEMLDYIQAPNQIINETNMFNETPLHLAAQYGRLDTVSLLLSKGANVNTRNDLGENIIHVACSSGELQVVQYLLDNNLIDKNCIYAQTKLGETPLFLACGAGHCNIVNLLLSIMTDVSIKNIFGQTVLHVACLNGNLEVVKCLLEHDTIVENCLNNQSNDGQTPLHYVARKGFSNIVDLLLRKDADVNIKNKEGETPLHVACSNGQLKIVERLVDKNCINDRDNNDQTPLHHAARKGYINVVDFLLSKGADATIRNINGETSLHSACQSRKIKIVERLLQHDSNCLNDQDNKGQTLLHCATLEHNLSTVNLLLSKGADANMKNKEGKTLLHLACSGKNKKFLEHVLRHDAIDSNCINEQDNDGETILHDAARGGHLNIVNLIVSKKGDANIKNNSGETALDLATRYDKIEIVQRLLEYLT